MAPYHLGTSAAIGVGAILPLWKEERQRVPATISITTTWWGVVTASSAPPIPIFSLCSVHPPALYAVQALAGHLIGAR